MNFFRSKKANNYEEIEEEMFFPLHSSSELEEQTVVVTAQAVAEIARQKEVKPRQPRKVRSHLKEFWNYGYANWSNDEFKLHLRIDRGTFQELLDKIGHFLEKKSTNFEPFPIEPHRQLALTLYRLGHGCTFAVISDLFGVSVSLAIQTFNEIIRLMISEMFDEYVFLPRNENEWIEECKGFLENYNFPCVGSWDRFHVHVSTGLKNHYSFKNRYTITNMGLIGYNKRFLALTAGAPGSTHDARLLRRSKAFTDIVSGNALPDKAIILSEDIGDIPLITIGDSAFPRYSWLLKMFNENTQDPKEKYFNKKLCSARVVAENCYGMLKGRFRIIYKKCECQLSNAKYIIMACVLLHNLCIARNDPCLPRWRLSVEEIKTVEKRLVREENRQGSNTNAKRIAEWLWEYQ